MDERVDPAAEPEKPRREIPEWKLRLARFLEFVDTGGLSRVIKPPPATPERRD